VEAKLMFIYSFVDVAGMMPSFQKNIDGTTVIKGSFTLPVGLRKQNVSGNYLM